MVLNAHKWLYSSKVVVFGQSGCILGKSGCIWANLVVFGQSCSRAKMDVIGQKWFYSGKSGCNWAKVVLFGKKFLC